MRYRRATTLDEGPIYFPEDVECPAPAPFMHGSYTFSNRKCPQKSTNPDCKIPDSAPVPHGWFVHFSCDPGYTLNTTSASSICSGTGWTPPLKTECVADPLCPPMNPVNGIVKCMFQGKEVACDAPMNPGTKARLKCKLHYRPVHGSENPQFLCLPNGHWDHLLFQCIPSCGQSRGAVQVSSLIYKGLNATVGLFPWHAGLYYREVKKGIISWEQRCGGSLITDQFVLTAAHCVKNVNKRDIRIALGKYHRSWDHQEDTEEKRNVSRILIPRVYNKNTLVFDIALMQLDEKIKFGEFIMPVCHGLMDGSNDILGKNLFIVGWGRTEDVAGGPSSEILRYTDVKMVNSKVCQAKIPSFHYSDEKFCTIKTNYSVSAALPGDSGGGLTVVFEGLHYIFGIVSQKIDEYSLFTNLTYTVHTAWIEDTMRMHDKHFTWVENHISIFNNCTSETGENCGIYFNECQSNPCVYGNCTNDIINYHCECEDGYEGVNCEDEIDECERYKPCVHGSCLDLKASYYCSCAAGYGGRNCTVQLTGCKGEPCLNNGSCKPYLEDEKRQLFNCSCIHGYHGHTCDKPTTMSLNDTSNVDIRTRHEKGYDLQFRFKTNIATNGLVFNRGYPYCALKLRGGILNLHTTLLSNPEGVRIGSGLNNGAWQQVSLSINESHLALLVNEENLIHPINIIKPTPFSLYEETSIHETSFGGIESAYPPHPKRPWSKFGLFIGCVQDVKVDGLWVLPSEDQNEVWRKKNIEVGCNRISQCEPNPCQRGGECTDLWQKFRCTCTRPYVGEKCEYNYAAATFWKENVDPSPVVVTLRETARKAFRNTVDISMFIRTRQKQGGIFYLGSTPSPLSTSSPGEVFIIAHLFEGELQVQIQYRHTSESYGVPGIKLDDGHYHLIQIVRNYSLVQVKIDRTEHVRDTIGTSDKLNLQTLYLGGLPEVLGPTQHASNARPASVSSKNPVPPAYFKGVIQDVQVSNGQRVMIVEFFPLKNSKGKLKLPMSLGSVEINTTSVIRGDFFDDVCNDNPCENNGTCHVTRNDYECDCTVGFKGKRCNELDFCTTTACPDGSRCQNLVYGYECVAIVTRRPDFAGLHYRLVQGNGSTALDTISISYFPFESGTLLHIAMEDMPNYYFTIHHHKDAAAFTSFLEISWNFKKDQNILKLPVDPESDWSTINLRMDSTLSGGLDGDFGDTLIPTNFPIVEWHELIVSSNIFVGSNGERKSLYTKDGSLYDGPFSSNYEGCFGEVRIGGLLLPFFSPDAIKINNTNNRFVLQDPTHSPIIGCYHCLDSDCRNGGVCEDPENSKSCK